jgi:hypothetical protein
MTMLALLLCLLSTFVGARDGQPCRPAVSRRTGARAAPDALEHPRRAATGGIQERRPASSDDLDAWARIVRGVAPGEAAVGRPDGSAVDVSEGAGPVVDVPYQLPCVPWPSALLTHHPLEP